MAKSTKFEVQDNSFGSPVGRIQFGSSIYFMGSEQMIIDVSMPHFKDRVKMFYDGNGNFTLVDLTGKHNAKPRCVATTNVKCWDME